MDMTYTYRTATQTIGGSIDCTTDYFGNVSCTNNPGYTIPGRTYDKVLRVHVDCTDQTYDAKGDRQGWKSWRESAAVYRAASQRCFG